MSTLSGTNKLNASAIRNVRKGTGMRARPRLISSADSRQWGTGAGGIVAGAGGLGDGGQVVFDEKSVSRDADWMYKDLVYINGTVLPKHRELMANKTQLPKQLRLGNHLEMCPKVKHDHKLMSALSTALYQCAEKGLLQVLPELNQPINSGLDDTNEEKRQRIADRWTSNKKD